MARTRDNSADERFPGVRLRIVGSGRGTVAAEQVGLFLFDFTVAFELFRRIVETDAGEHLSQWDLYRGHRRVPLVERLTIERLRMESPMEVIATCITLTAGGIGAVWASVQALERIYMFPINRKKAELELRKLEHEVRQLDTGLHDVAALPSLRRLSLDSGPQAPSATDAGPHRALTRRSPVPREARLTDLVRREDDERVMRDADYGKSREVVETVRRRLLRNPIQVEQLELEFDANLSPPSG